MRHVKHFLEGIGLAILTTVVLLGVIFVAGVTFKLAQDTYGDPGAAYWFVGVVFVCAGLLCAYIRQDED